MRGKKVFLFSLAVFVLFAFLVSPSFCADIEALVDLFFSNPSAATDQLLELLDKDPDAFVLVLAQVAERIAKLPPDDPKRVSLEERIETLCIALIDIKPDVVAKVVVTITERAPEIGEKIEQVAVAWGLEESYLKAASPVRP